MLELVLTLFLYDFLQDSVSPLYHHHETEYMSEFRFSVSFCEKKKKNSFSLGRPIKEGGGWEPPLLPANIN